MPMSGTLYGIGVGPGAPDLLTLRAVRVLSEVDVILAAASPRNDYSTALETARPHLNPKARLLRLDFPMTHDKTILHAAWQIAARQTLQVLEGGENAAFLTIGDPLIYSTFGYLWRTLREHTPDARVEVIPGITSFQAAAARLGTILCEGSESLRIIPGINGREHLAAELAGADTAVILKAYRNYPVIREVLEDADRIDTASLASHVEQEGENLCHDMRGLEGSPPYLSLVLSRKGS